MYKLRNYVGAEGKRHDFAFVLPIQRVEEQPHGTLPVYGVVTAGQPDRDKEVCDYAKTKPYYEKTVAEMIKTTSGTPAQGIRWAWT